MLTRVHLGKWQNQQTRQPRGITLSLFDNCSNGFSIQMRYKQMFEMKIFSCLKPQWPESWYLVYSIYLRSFSKFVQIMGSSSVTWYTYANIGKTQNKTKSCLKQQGPESRYFASPSWWSSPSSFKLWPNMSPPQEAHVLYRLIQGKHKQSSYLKQNGIQPWYFYM